MNLIGKSSNDNLLDSLESCGMFVQFKIMASFLLMHLKPYQILGGIVNKKYLSFEFN